MKLNILEVNVFLTYFPRLMSCYLDVLVIEISFQTILILTNWSVISPNVDYSPISCQNIMLRKHRNVSSFCIKTCVFDTISRYYPLSCSFNSREEYWCFDDTFRWRFVLSVHSILNQYFYKLNRLFWVKVDCLVWMEVHFWFVPTKNSNLYVEIEIMFG